MAYVAAAAVCALALVTAAALHTVGQLVRSHARERNLMLNQLLHLAGRTWEPPPAEPTPEPDDGESFDERFVLNPTQLPDF